LLAPILQDLRSLGLVKRAVACVNRVLHLVLCHIHSSLSSSFQISASAADLIDAVIHAVSNIASQFLARLRRKEQSKRRAYSPAPTAKVAIAPGIRFLFIVSPFP